ncbi:MAG: VWA domain-containing protein [Actinomycetota bacterium]|nr:VWA domain-containing protein [Actinomycetota bacterium]
MAAAADSSGRPGPSGMTEQVLAFCEALRKEGVAIGTSEIQDAFRALEIVPWQVPVDFKESLAATVAKSPKDREIFELVFDRHFFRATEEAALEFREESEAARTAQVGEAGGDEGQIDTEALVDAIREAIEAGDESAMNDLARLAIEAFGQQGESSGVVGVDLQRIRRGLGLTANEGEGENATPPLDRDQLARFERQLRRELQRGQIERQGQLPPARPLSELNRALPMRGAQDLAEVHKAVSQMKRRLATLGHDPRGAKRGRTVDVRRTMRSSLETGGVPLNLAYRPRRPRKPEIYVLCDVSTSVSSAATFFLSVLHALHDSFRKLRSFVFIERISEVTHVFQEERDFRQMAERVTSEGGVADVSGYTDYGRVWREFLEDVSSDLGPRSTVIVLGDARTNGRPPAEDLFAKVADRANRTFWLNPEPELYWNYGDSVMDAYIPYCDGAFECWQTEHLERFVDIVASGRPSLQRPAKRRSGHRY